MKRLVLLHTNDIHGNVEGLARVATLVDEIRDGALWPTAYVDAGDVEESTTRISNTTKGTAMHQLLGAAGCLAAAVGNASWLRYGPGVLPQHQAAAPYPLLLANVRSPDGSVLDGVVETALIPVGDVMLGLTGVTAPYENFGADTLGVSWVDPGEAVRAHASSLRARGADFVVLLSHLGLDVPDAAIDDRRLASQVGGHVDLIVGAHSHDVLPAGETIDGVPVVQAGSHANYLGRVDLGPGGASCELLPVDVGTPCHPAVMAAADAIDRETREFLDEVVGELPRPMSAEEAAGWLADVLRRRLAADVAIVVPGSAFASAIPGGPLSRGALWDACDSTACPGVVTMTGEQLQVVLERGRDAMLAESTPSTLRGQKCGVLQMSGGEHLEAGRDYRVAGTDWELEPYGGLVESQWTLRPEYEFPTIVREVVEAHLPEVRP